MFCDARAKLVLTDGSLMNETNLLPSEKPGKMRFEGIVHILVIGFGRLRGIHDVDDETTGDNPPDPEDFAGSLNEKKTL